VTPDGSKFYVTGECVKPHHDCLFVIETDTYKITSAFLCELCTAIAVSPDGSKYYVAAYNEVLGFSTATNAMIDQFKLQSAYDLAVSPNGKMLYVTSGQFTATVLNIINLTTKRITPVISNAAPSTTCVAVSPDGSKVYITVMPHIVWVLSAATKRIIDKVDPVRFRVVKTIIVGGYPTAFGKFIQP
jgi:DNA-binding beta-propeller fold protein YncE